MITKKKLSDYGVIVGNEEVDVLDNPEDGAPKVCQLHPGRTVRLLSKPNKKYLGIGVTKAVMGFVLKENVEEV